MIVNISISSVFRGVEDWTGSINSGSISSPLWIFNSGDHSTLKSVSNLSLNYLLNTEDFSICSFSFLSKHSSKSLTNNPIPLKDI